MAIQNGTLLPAGTSPFMIAIMYPILGRIGPFLVYSYTVAIWAGIAGGLGFAYWFGRQRQLPWMWLDAVLVCVTTGLVGGRAGYVLREWAYFEGRLPAVVRVWEGGLAYHGALWAGLLGLGGWLWWQKRPFWLTLDLLTPGLAWTHCCGWLGCWLAGCAYGRITVWRSALWLDWLAADLPDNFGVFALRYQTQLLGAGLALLILLILLRLRRRLAPGVLFALGLALLSCSRIPVALLRGDPVRILAGVRVDLLLDVLMVVLALVLLQYRWRE